MIHFDKMKVGAEVRHIDDKLDLEGEIVKVEDLYVWVQVPNGGEPQRSMMGFWIVTKLAPNTNCRAA